MRLKVRMKITTFLAILLCASLVGAEETGLLRTQKEKTSYSVGVEMATNLKRQGFDVDVEVLLTGIRHVLTGESLLMTDSEMIKAMAMARVELKEKRMQGMGGRSKNTEELRQENEAFLAENKTKEGVIALPSGLQYKILKAGNGKTPTEADTVECNYRGTLIDGTEFDSSYRRKQSTIFKVAEVIPGWREALTLMPVGSKWQLFIPPHLGYGARGTRGLIGPDATLILEVELLAIK